MAKTLRQNEGWEEDFHSTFQVILDEVHCNHFSLSAIVLRIERYIKASLSTNILWSEKFVRRFFYPITAWMNTSLIGWASLLWTWIWLTISHNYLKLTHRDFFRIVFGCKIKLVVSPVFHHFWVSFAIFSKKNYFMSIHIPIQLTSNLQRFGSTNINTQVQLEYWQGSHSSFQLLAMFPLEWFLNWFVEYVE